MEKKKTNNKTSSSKTSSKKKIATSKKTVATSKSNKEAVSEKPIELENIAPEELEAIKQDSSSLVEEVTDKEVDHQDEENKKDDDQKKSDAPTQSATKVFGNIAAFKWWGKLGILNAIWSIGFIFIFLAFFWTGDLASTGGGDKLIANKIFAFILFGIGLLGTIVTTIIYCRKNITPFNSMFNKISLVLANLMPFGFIPIMFLSSKESKAFYEYDKVQKLGYVKPKKEMPHVYVILMAIIFMIIVASWLVTWTGSPGVTGATFSITYNNVSYEIAYNISDGVGSFSTNTNGIDNIISALMPSNESVPLFETKAQLGEYVRNHLSNIITKPEDMQSAIDSIAFNDSVSPAGFLYVLMAPLKGFTDAADLIIFLMIMGGFLAIVTESQALEAGLGRMVKKMKGKEIIMVPILFMLFSVGGATYGMAEETIPFYLLLIPVFLAAGFDTYTAFLTILLGAGLGVSASILNPFVVGTAVDAIPDIIGENGKPINLSTSMGITWRSVIYAVFVVAGAVYVTWYAWRVKKHPEKSAVYDLREEHQKSFSFNIDSLPEFTIKRKIILAVFGLTFVAMIISVISWKDITGSHAFINAANWMNKYFPFIGGLSLNGEGLIGAWGTWYLLEMSFLFLLSSLIIGGLSWQGHKHFISKFMAGILDFVGVGLVIAISRGISVVIKETGLSTLIIQGLGNVIGGIGNAYGVLIVFFLLFIVLSFLIPSTSGFASAVFPILGPAVGQCFNLGLTISGQIATFSLASSVVNICSPSSGIFIAALSVSKIPLMTFYKKSWYVLVAIFVGSIVMIMIGQAVNGTHFASLSDSILAPF